jgi:hypothetical protein
VTDDLHNDVAYRMRNRIDDFQVEQRVVAVLCRLPEDVREFALDHCYFVAIGDDIGGYYVSRETLMAEQEDLRWLVILNSSWKGDDLPSVVARELAHIWLKHPEFDFGLDIDRHENQAAEQVRAWGFEGIGSVPLSDRP